MKQLNPEQKYNDFELIYLIREHHEKAYEILQKKYEPIIVHFAKKMKNVYPNIGLDISDYINEGWSVLDYAVNYFDEERNDLFYTYVCSYLKYRINNYARVNRKDQSLNNAIEWKDIYQTKYDPNEINLEIKYSVDTILKNLKDIEKRIFFLKIKGYSYKEIANMLKLDRKKVDNTLLKIRRLLKKRVEL